MTRRRTRISYLAGAIDTVADRGLGWRKRFANALAKVGIGVVIPNDIEEKELPPAQMMALKVKDVDEFKRTFRKHIIRPDLAAMDACDMVVVRWNGEAIAGTAHECGRAFMRGQPVFLVTPRSFLKVPSWLLACCDKEFHTIDELVEYLRTRKTRRVKGAAE
jgi:nucleoside 2-deoxyribosyltransferase